MLGEARSKFATIAGPQGGGTLNGTAMKGEAQTQMDVLIEQQMGEAEQRARSSDGPGRPGFCEELESVAAEQQFLADGSGQERSHDPREVAGLGRLPMGPAEGHCGEDDGAEGAAA